MASQIPLEQSVRSSQIGEAVADLRSTARWTIAAAGAVGALLLGGAPIAAIGKINDLGDAISAYAGLAIALAGVGWAIWQTTEALIPRIATLAQLDDPDMASLREMIIREPDEAKLRMLDQALDDARANAELADRLGNELLELIHAWKIRAAVRRARLH